MHHPQGTCNYIYNIYYNKSSLVVHPIKLKSVMQLTLQQIPFKAIKK